MKRAGKGRIMSAFSDDENVLHYLTDLPLTLDPDCDIRGRQVFGSDGATVGVVRELIVSHDNQRIVFVQIEHGTLVGRRKFLVAVEELVIRPPNRLGIRDGQTAQGEIPWECPCLSSKAPALEASQAGAQR